MFKAKTVENFLGQQECEYLVSLTKDSDLWESIPHSSWDKRSIYIETSYKNMPREAFDLIKNATLNVKKFIEENMSDGRQVYPDIASINRWFPGMYQDPHADDMTNTDVTGYEHRVFGSIIYLNTEYEGGHTYYPNHNIEITPKTGMVAIHPGDVEHLHGVTEIQGGMRYTIASFWVYDKDRGIDWSIYQ